MNPLGLILLLSLGAIWAGYRLLRHARRWRLLLLALLALQVLAIAGLLWPRPPAALRLELVQSSAQAAALRDVPVAADTVRLLLPTAVDRAAPAQAVVPDLGSALRLYPAVEQVVVYGRGLSSVDQAALGDRSLQLQLDPPPTGLIDVQWPRRPQAGARWLLQGRVQRGAAEPASALPLRLEWLDPAGQRIAEQTLPAEQSVFRFVGRAAQPGPLRFMLRLWQGESLLEAAPVAVDAQASSMQHGLLWAATPSPEVRALRRWAEDSGQALAARIGLAPTLQLRRDAVEVSPELDLLLLDERSWPAQASERQAIRAAVEAGMGLLLRLSSPLDRRSQALLAELGFDASAAAEAGAEPLREVQLPAPWQTAEDAPLQAWSLGFSGAALQPLLVDRQGRWLGAWRRAGQGRIGVLALNDTFRLQSRGQADAYASLWADLWSTLARADGTAATVWPEWHWVDRRISLCGIPAARVLRAPSGRQAALQSAAAMPSCLAVWPEEPGWQRVLGANGATLANLYLLPAEAWPAQRDAQRLRANQALAARLPWPAEVASWQPDPRLWALLWLLAFAASMALERRLRLGTGAGAAVQAAPTSGAGTASGGGQV